MIRKPADFKFNKREEEAKIIVLKETPKESVDIQNFCDVDESSFITRKRNRTRRTLKLKEGDKYFEFLMK